MRDEIISKNSENGSIKIEYIEHPSIPFYFTGTITDNLLNNDLFELIIEYTEIVDNMALSLLDEVEEKLAIQGFCLKNSQVKIFNIEIVTDHISFFSKYPSSKGYLDDYP